MKIVAISDTHGQHAQVSLPAEGDVLIHAGDMTQRGLLSEVLSFLEWFSNTDFEHKILIAGNHDFYFEDADAADIAQIIPKNVTYLNDSGTTVGNLKIWGSPIQPTFMNMAFNRERGEAIRKHWDLIPAGTDILVTHGPAYGVLDRTTRGISAGCKDLLHRILEVKPQLHVCGHIHEAYGSYQRDGVLFMNVSSWYMFEGVRNRPMKIEL